MEGIYLRATRKMITIACAIMGVIFLIGCKKTVKIEKALQKVAEEKVEGETVISAYTSILEEYKKNITMSTRPVRYKLIYLNNDDIPELAVIEDDIRAAGAQLYYCTDGEAQLLTAIHNDSELDSYGCYGQFTYNEREGIVKSYYERNGGAGYFNNICFWNGDKEMSILKEYSLDIIYGEAQDDFDKVTQTYFIDGEKVSAEAFSDLCKQWDSEHEKTFYYGDEDSMAIYADTNVWQSLIECWSTMRK